MSLPVTSDVKISNLDDFDFKNKTVLLRLDLNSEIKDKKEWCVFLHSRVDLRTP